MRAAAIFLVAAGVAGGVAVAASPERLTAANAAARAAVRQAEAVMSFVAASPS